MASATLKNRATSSIRLDTGTENNANYDTWSSNSRSFALAARDAFLIL
jgi:hypothetical protein